MIYIYICVCVCVLVITRYICIHIYYLGVPLGVTGSVSVNAVGDRNTDFILQIYRGNFTIVAQYYSFAREYVTFLEVRRHCYICA